MHDIHEGVCWVCRTFVELHEMETDHVIAKSHRKKAGRINLPPSFDFDALENLLPSHPRCNLLKSDKENNYYNAIAIGNAANKAVLIRTKVAKLKASKEVAGVLARINQHIDSGQLTPDDLEVFRQALRQADERQYLSWLDPRWRNVRRVSDSLVEATGPLGSGLAAIGPNRSSEYLCPGCGGYGPWSGGARCCMCGYMGMPAD
jgi:hypothetical protein